METDHESVPGWIPGGGSGTPPVGWSPQVTPTPVGGIPGWGTAGPTGGQGNSGRSSGCGAAGVIVIVIVIVLLFVPIVGLLFLGGHVSTILSTVGTELSSLPPDAGQPSGGTVNVLDLAVGNCIDSPADARRTVSQLTLLPCSAAHAAEIVAVIDLPYAPDAPYPGDTEIEQQSLTRCTAAFTTYVGIPQDGSIYRADWYRVTEQGWASGDRSIDCLATSDDGTPIVGSIKGVRR